MIPMVRNGFNPTKTTNEFREESLRTQSTDLYFNHLRVLFPFNSALVNPGLVDVVQDIRRH